MAENQGGLSSTFDVTKTPVYGATEQQYQDLRDAQQKAVEALEQRYSQPNWWKVAAGFAKPQLGGFLASLGSASEAMGENLEQQRAQQLPIAQMRAQLAQTDMMMGAKRKAADIVSKAHNENRQLTPNEIEEISNLDPERGHQLIQAQEARSKTVANNLALTQHNATASGQPQPVVNEMGLPETGNFPVGGTSATPVDTGRTLPPNVGANAWHKGLIGEESSGNPNAVNPDSKAAGLYQVLPSTSKDPGYGIAPAKDQSVGEMNRIGSEYAEAMAGKLGPAWGALAHHYGEGQVKDWLKMGDLSKLPDEARKYVGDIALRQFKPGTSSDVVPSAMKQELPSSMPGLSPMAPITEQSKALMANLTDSNSKYREDYFNIRNAVGPTSRLGSQVYSAVNSLKKQLSYDKDETIVGKDGASHNLKEEQLQRVMGVLSQGGVLNAAMAAAAKGLGVTTPIGATHIDMPFEEFLSKKLPVDDQEIARNIGMNLGKLALWQQQNAGQSLGNMPVSEINILNSASPNQGMPLNSIRYGVAHASNQLDYLKNILDGTTQLMNNQHPKYKLSDRDISIPYHAAYNSPVIQDAWSDYLKKNDEIESLDQAGHKFQRMKNFNK